MMTKLVSSFFTDASGIVARSDPKIFSVFKAKDGHFPWRSVQLKIQLVFERLWEIRKHHKVRGDGMLAQAAFLSAACKQKRWSIPRIDKVILFAHVADPELEALATRLGSGQDPFTTMDRLDEKYKKGENTVNAIEQQLEEMKKKSENPGDPKAISDLRAQLDSQNAEIEKSKRSAADSKRGREKYKKETWERNNPDSPTSRPRAGARRGGGEREREITPAPAPAPAPTAAATAAAAENG
jgi:hypothetical protein